jgi:type I restriction enzyme M protein
MLNKELELLVEKYQAYVNLNDLRDMILTFVLLKEKNLSSIQDIINTIENIENENPKLKNILTKRYEMLSESAVLDILNKVKNIVLKDDADILGQIYEFFLGFKPAETREMSAFFTPACLVQMVIKMLLPNKGIIYDPTMGTAGFFVSAINAIELAGGNKKDITFYGQEINRSSWSFATINAFLKNLDFNFAHGNTLLNNQYPNLKADFVLSNPPFNQKDWYDTNPLYNDPRFQHFEHPPKSNANFAWILHILHHTADAGKAVVVISNNTLSTTQKQELAIRRTIVEKDWLECIIALPTNLFSNTSIPACIWILNKQKTKSKQTLFFDLKNKGTMVNRTLRVLDEKDINEVASTYLKWTSDNSYQDIPEYCKSVSTEDIQNKSYSLVSGNYIDLEVKQEDIPFAEKFSALKKELYRLMDEETELNKRIRKNLDSLVEDDKK